MKTLLLAVLFSAAPKTAAVAKPATPEELLASVQKRYDGFDDFSAEFQQTLVQATRLGKGRSEIGTLYLKRPGLFRVDYSAPTVKNFIVDGQRLWVYKPDDSIVGVYDHFKDADVSAGLSFLWNKKKKLVDEFDAKHFTGTDPLEEPVPERAIRLTPRKDDPQIKTITFYLDDKSFIERAIIEDHLGNYNVYKFRNFKVDQKLKKNAFLFTPPDGVKVQHID